jgi:hypothetical protein
MELRRQLRVEAARQRWNRRVSVPAKQEVSCHRTTLIHQHSGEADRRQHPGLFVQLPTQSERRRHETEQPVNLRPGSSLRTLLHRRLRSRHARSSSRCQRRKTDLCRHVGSRPSCPLRSSQVLPRAKRKHGREVPHAAFPAAPEVETGLASVPVRALVHAYLPGTGWPEVSGDIITVARPGTAAGMVGGLAAIPPSLPRS